MDDENGADRHLALMADVVAAYVSNNSLPLNDLPALMRSVHTSLVDLATGHVPVPPEEPKPPAVPVKKSITPDFLICLEDGKKFRSLKRHLGTVYKLTPEKYREKWGLPSDYPMVAPAYSAVRSQLAKAIGLGQTGRVEMEPADAHATRGHRAGTQDIHAEVDDGAIDGHDPHGADGHEAGAHRTKAAPKAVAEAVTVEGGKAEDVKRSGRSKAKPAAGD